jgi:3-methyladenine DNA glycosylase Mpg
MGISLGENRLDLLGAVLYLEDRGHGVDEVAWSPRVGITKGAERRWRCYVAASPSVSARKN